MRYVLRLAVVLGAILVPLARAAAEEPTAAEVTVLGRALLDDRLEVAIDAAKKLHALGEHAAPALPELALALARELDPDRAGLHWHPDQALMPRLRLEVVKTLGAIGPKAKPLLHALGLLLPRSSGVLRCAIVRALLAIAPEDEQTFRALSHVVADGRWRLGDEDCEALLRAWVEMQGERAGPMLAGVLARGTTPDKAWAAKRLAAMGEAGDGFLLEHLETAVWMGRKLVLDTYAEVGKMPRAAVPAAVRWYLDEGFDGDRAAYAHAIANSCTPVCEAVGKALADLDLWDAPWRELYAASPEAGRAASAFWFGKRRPERDEAGFDEQGMRRTPTRGGKGGGAFLDQPARRLALTGFRVTTAKMADHAIVTSLRPLYDGPEGPYEGNLHGHPRGPVEEIRAPKGFAVGGLYVKSGKRVDGFAVVFLKRTEKGLDPNMARVSRWIGGTGGGEAVLLGGQGFRIIGVHGRRGTDIDALGLVETN